MSQPFQPIISVIVATYQSARTLQYTLKAILAQTFTNFELLVIGDHCTDNSEQVVSQFDDSRVRWINLEKRSGSQSGPNNEGLRLSKGKYIAFCGHDDLWFPDHLKQLKIFLESNAFDFVYALSVLINPLGAYAVIGAPSLGRSMENWHIPPSSWFFKKEITEKAGFWADMREISRGVDEEYLSRISKGRYNLEVCNKVFILKFPSADWKIYDQTLPFPQEKYHQQLTNQPEQLKFKLLLEIANTHSTYYSPRYPFKFHLIGVWKTSLLRKVLWNLISNKLLQKRNQKKFQLQRENKLYERGLK